MPVVQRSNSRPACSGNTIERRAEQCLERCRRIVNLNELPFPVPVEQWIEAPLGIGFGIDDLSHLGEGVLGAAFINDREILISQTLMDNDARFRFTCAHELGHFMLHARAAVKFTDTSVGTSLDRIEREADRFATAFLMPLSRFTQSLFRVLDAHRLDRRKCLGQLLMGGIEADWLWKKRLLPALTRGFGVSLSTALFRASEIRMPDGSALVLPEQIARLLSPVAVSEAIRTVRVIDGVPHCA